MRCSAAFVSRGGRGVLGESGGVLLIRVGRVCDPPLNVAKGGSQPALRLLETIPKLSGVKPDLRGSAGTCRGQTGFELSVLLGELCDASFRLIVGELHFLHLGTQQGELGHQIAPSGFA